MSLKKSSKMSTRAVNGQANNLKCGLKMPLMNCMNFGVFNIIKSIVDLSKDEQFVMVLDDMLAMFILQVIEKDDGLYLLMKYVILILFYFYYFFEILFIVNFSVLFQFFNGL
jgi:hypothetical protein